MTYEIPPPLQHKEKIIFGLTFSQLAIALPSFLSIFFLIFKSNLALELSVPLCTFVLTLAGFFMFFDGFAKTKHMLQFYKHREIRVNSDKIKNIININAIENNVITTSNSKLAILEITPMNLMIKPDEERKAVLARFQKFLNSLDFPVQIHISNSDINLDKHLKLQKKSKVAESYKKFIENTLEEHNVKNRKFFLIIKEVKDIETQTKVCQEKLINIGLKARRIRTNELLSLFFSYLADNKQKELAEGQEIDNFTQYLLSPEKVVFHHDFFQVDDAFHKVLAVKGYPQTVEMGFLDRLVSSNDQFDISIHIEPLSIDSSMVQLNRELQKQQSDLYAESKKGVLNPSLDIKFKSTRGVLEELQKGKQKLFNVSLYIMCKGKEKKDVELLAQKIKAELDGLMVQTRTPTFQMIDAYQSMLPLAKDSVSEKRNIHTTGLSAFFPFSSPFLDIDDNGVLLGLNKNNIPYIKDVYSLTNANGVVLATSGSGKSYFTKLLLSRQYMNGTDVLIIDPQGEYGAITDHYNGETITISKDSATIINPLDLMGHDYLEKRLMLMDLLVIMFGEMSEPQKALMDQAIEKTYKKKGITAQNWDNDPPKMGDLYKTLEQMEKKLGAREKSTCKSLLNRLSMYTKKGVFSFLDQDTNMDFSKKFVCFNIGEMPRQVKSVVMFLVLDFIYMRMKGSLNRKMLVIDEAWSLLQTAEESSYVFEIVKTCRKFNLGLLMITQDVADLVDSSAGHAVLANSSYTYLLRQKPAVIKNVVRTFHLSQFEKDYLLSAERGQGILLLENEHQELRVVASDEEHKLITTNPDEVKKVAKKPTKKKVVKQKELDLEQDVYTASSLSMEEKNLLNSNDYVLGSYHNLEKGRQKEYFVKKRRPEGAKHTFYVDLIYKEIRKHTKNVQKYRTEQPDIIFTNKKGKKIAIEVETGNYVKTLSKKKYHNEKFAKLKEQYGKRCHIFLTTALLKNSYTRHNLPMLCRLDIINFVKSHF